MMMIVKPASSKEVDDGDDQLLLAELLSPPLNLHQVPVDQVSGIGFHYGNNDDLDYDSDHVILIMMVMVQAPSPPPKGTSRSSPWHRHHQVQ